MNESRLKNLFKKVLIALLITIFLWLCKLSFVKAATVNVNLSELKFNNINLLDLSYYNIPEGNRTLYFDFDFSSTNENATIFYNSIVLCSDAQYTSAYATDPSEVTNIRMNNTSYSCTYSNSSYTGGKVVIITFATYSSGANSIVLYQNANASVQLIDFVVDTSGYVNPINYSSQTLINQNSQIINQNNTIINNQENIKNSTEDIKNSLTDETAPNLGGLNNSAGWLKPGPVDSILNLPLTLLNNLQTNLGNTCNPVTLTLPYVHKDISLPCISVIYKQIDGLDVWFQSIGVIAAAFILYKYFMYLYNKIDDTLSFRENSMEGYFDDSLWGGM